jgi:hypothetical protein
VSETPVAYEAARTLGVRPDPLGDCSRASATFLNGFAGRFRSNTRCRKSHLILIDSNGRTIWIADAHRDDGKRFVVRADEMLTAFVELERQVLTVTFYLESIHPDLADGQ